MFRAPTRFLRETNNLRCEDALTIRRLPGTRSSSDVRYPRKLPRMTPNSVSATDTCVCNEFCADGIAPKRIHAPELQSPPPKIQVR
jgi:hypothetical protein